MTPPAHRADRTLDRFVPGDTPPTLGCLEPLFRGKVRDLYLAPPSQPAAASPDADRRLVIVATDRISAFDVVMRTPVPGKGALLTTIARRWFEFVEAHGLARTHVQHWHASPDWGLSSDEARYLADRVCVCTRAHVIPVECVVRGYLDGSGWREYAENQSVCGVPLPPKLQRGSKLQSPIFTPATKARDGGHDDNITFDQACDIVGADVMRRARDLSLSIYAAGAAHAEQRGVILADTKFEFGFPLDDTNQPADTSPDALMLVDEVLTPDSSRYWPADAWSPGAAQPSYDKQFLREHLQALADRGDWDKAPDNDGLGPALPDHILAGTRDRYREVYDRLWS
jgi:phosphoribosylaminoimidazole-succinocarboxamide synthase